MVTLYESTGNFNSGVNSYRSLISKRSRGTIILTEKILSFESQIDKILFQIKVSDIKDFSIKNRRSIPLLELKTVPGDIYNLYPWNDNKKVPHSSRIMTEELFRQLTRLKFNNNQPILFDTIGIIYPDPIQNKPSKSNGLHGHLFLTENYILFNSFKKGSLIQVEILDIKGILMQIIDSNTYVVIKTNIENIYYFLSLKVHHRRYTKDRIKTEKFYDVLNQAIMYKASESLELDSQKTNKTMEEEISKTECYFCGEIINSEVEICPFCDTYLIEDI